MGFGFPLLLLDAATVFGMSGISIANGGEKVNTVLVRGGSSIDKYLKLRYNKHSCQLLWHFETRSTLP